MLWDYPTEPPGAQEVLTALFSTRVFGDNAPLYVPYWARLLAPMTRAGNVGNRSAAFFLTARLTEAEIARLRALFNANLLSQDNLDAIVALDIEETRRANRARFLEDGRNRGALLQADFGVAFANRNGGRIFLDVMAPMVSGLIAPRVNPLHPNVSGPLPTNRDRLAQLVANAQAAAAAAAAHPAGVVRRLSDLADEIRSLEESVSKRPRH